MAAGRPFSQGADPTTSGAWRWSTIRHDFFASGPEAVTRTGNDPSGASAFATSFTIIPPALVSAGAAVTAEGRPLHANVAPFGI
jgi:hypothetical protein